MGLFFVFQGDSYQQQKENNILASPQRDKNGNKDSGYSTMKLVKKGDIIFHCAKQLIKAISIATKNCFPVIDITTDYNGYKVKTEYYELENPLLVSNYQQWLIDNNYKNGPYDKKGKGNQKYLSVLKDNFALFFIDKIIETQESQTAINKAKEFKKSIINIINEDREVDNYNNLEHHNIEENIDSLTSSPTWDRKAKPAEYIDSPNTNRKIPKRSSKIAARALKKANFVCENNQSDRVFLRKTGTHNYTEPHHLIPLSKQSEFKGNSVDIEENIVSLCSYCHNLLHYGRFEDKEQILRKLFNERKEALKDCGIKLNFRELMEYYK